MHYLIFLIAIIFNCSVKAKAPDFIQIETNKTLSLFAFVETVIGARSTSLSFQQYIDENLVKTAETNLLLSQYKKLNFSYQFKLEEVPSNRHSYRDVKDLLWITASNSKSIYDFSSRIQGLLPHRTHVEFISILSKLEPIYDKLIWKTQKKNIKRIEKQLSKYTQQIEEMFLKISHFYGTDWDKSIPFKIMLYPIPLKDGHTTAIAKGNTLIIGFLTENENDYLSRLGIIIHEMVHILYREQPINLQTKIDEWFTESNSEYAKLTYNYLNEGLATAIGNGWAYQQIHGKLDEDEWYSNQYINDFGKALFPLISKQLSKNSKMDKNFINKSIKLFSQTFPNAVNETQVLLNELFLYTNSDDDINNTTISNTFHKYFDIRSQWSFRPIVESNSIEEVNKIQTTKVFVINKDHKETMKVLKKQFLSLRKNDLTYSKDFIYSFKDTHTKSTIILINIHSLDELEPAIRKLASEKFLTLGIQ